MSRGKFLLLGIAVAGLIAVAAILVFLVWSYVLTPSLKVTDLHPGDEVTLRSGVSFTVPPRASGSLAKWRSKDAKLNNPLGLSDEAGVNFPTAPKESGIFLDVYWAEGNASSPLAMIGRTTRLAAASEDGTVQVRWARPRPGYLNVFVVTRLPGRLPGVLSYSAENAKDAGAAWRAARDVWRLLRVIDVQLPPHPG